MKNHLFVLLILSATLFGCDSSNDPSNGKDVLVPLFPGRTWCYDVEGFALITADSGVWNYEDCDSIEYLNSQGDELWYWDKYNHTLGNESFIGYTNKEDGLWVLIPGHWWTTEKLLFPFPVEIGTMMKPDTITISRTDTLNSCNRYEDTAVGALKLVSKDTLIKVAAGYFSCYHYQKEIRYIKTDKLYRKEDDYFAVNIGRIQSSILYSDSMYQHMNYQAKLKRMNWRK